MKNNWLITLVIVGGLSFYAGVKYQQSRQFTFSGQLGNGQFMMRNGERVGNTNGNNRGGFRPVSGEIISTDDKSITVKLQDGSSKIIFLTDKTNINRAESVDKSELKTGVKIAVFGTENNDGTISAQNIQLNLLMRNQ